MNVVPCDVHARMTPYPAPNVAWNDVHASVPLSDRGLHEPPREPPRRGQPSRPCASSSRRGQLGADGAPLDARILARFHRRGSSVPLCDRFGVVLRFTIGGEARREAASQTASLLLREGERLAEDVLGGGRGTRLQRTTGASATASVNRERQGLPPRITRSRTGPATRQRPSSGRRMGPALLQ